MNTASMHKPIGVFDSGIGGLTVFKEVRKLLPEEQILYLGDTARVPYGIRSAETVIKYSIKNTEFLLQQNIKLLVIACNTASAVAKAYLTERYDIPVIDVVSPGARHAVRVTRNKRIGIIGTYGTITSGAYQREILRADPAIQTFAQPCPLFVPLAEEGWFSNDDSVAVTVAKRYIAPLCKHSIDTLVLGCTHYPLLKPVIQEIAGKDVTLIDSARETAKEVLRLLQDNDMLSTHHLHQDTQSIFYVTDLSPQFKKIGALFLGEAFDNISLVDI